MLPIGYSLPLYCSTLPSLTAALRIPSTSTTMPAEADADTSGPPQPSMLYDLDTLDLTTHPHAARAISAIVDAEEFLVYTSMLTLWARHVYLTAPGPELLAPPHPTGARFRSYSWYLRVPAPI